MAVLGYAQLLQPGSTNIVVNSVKAQAPITVTTAPISTAGANVICVGVSDNNVTISNVTDNQGNTYTRIVQRTNSFLRTAIYVCFNPTTSATHTFTYGGNASQFPSLIATAFNKPTVTSPVDKNNGNTATATTINTGSVTPAFNDEIIFAVAANGNNTTGIFNAVSNGYSFLETLPFTVSTGFSTATAYLLQTTAAATSTTFTNTLSATMSSCIISIN